jgi:hypothetical protein
VKEREYGAYTVYMCVNGKMIPVETIPGMGWEWRKMVEGVNSKYDVFYILKNFCKCHNVPPPSTINF